MPTLFKEKNIADTVGLRQSEVILTVARRHHIMLLRSLIMPFSFFLLSIALLVFYSLGGQFMVQDATFTQQYTAVDQMLTYGLALLVLAAMFLPRRTPARNPLRAVLVAVALLLAALLLFRAQGGRVIAMNPYATQSFDAVSFAFISLAVLAVLACFYAWRDWSADRIVLTNERVIYEFERPWIRRVQEHLGLADVQQVEASTRTYLEHWLNFGTLRIQSASISRAMMFFGAAHPRELQARIMTEVQRVQEDESDANLRELIETRVYNDEAAAQAPLPRHIHRSYTPQALDWLFTENPEFYPQQETFIWHPHWLFLLRALLEPVAALVLILGLVFAGTAYGVVSGGLTWGVVLVAVLLLGAWAAWRVEDYRNERYIVTPVRVTDIHKKPFGPERRNSAGLDSLQNVTYRTTFISRLLGYGDVILETAGAGDNLTFPAIPNPRQVVSIINDYQEKFNERQKQRSLEETLKLLRYYHVDQQRRSEPAGNNGNSEQQPAPSMVAASAG